MRVFEHRVLRRTFGAKRDRVTEEWSRLHNEVLNALFLTKYLCDQIKTNEKDSACCTYGGKERCREGFGGET
jgi:hypothetical protein